MLLRIGGRRLVSGERERGARGGLARGASPLLRATVKVNYPSIARAVRRGVSAMAPAGGGRCLSGEPQGAGTGAETGGGATAKGCERVRATCADGRRHSTRRMPWSSVGMGSGLHNERGQGGRLS